MRTEPGGRRLPLAARRVFRLALTVALTLAGSYALALPLPFLPPIFALLLSAAPSRPLRLKTLIGLLLLVIAMTGLGLLLIPVLTHYRAVGLTLVAIGLYTANDLSLNHGKGLVGSLMTVGLTLITAAGVANFGLAVMVIESLTFAIILAVSSQFLVYPLFPEDPAPATAPEPPAQRSSRAIEDHWAALRSTIIVFPTFLLALINPSSFMAIVMKSVSLGSQSSLMKARDAGRELLSSTLMGGFLSILLWFGLKLDATLWMFFLWTLLLGILVASKLYGVVTTRYSASFWSNAMVTVFILIGPAVADSQGGKDPYKAFAVRMSLFVAVTLYAWVAVVLLERLRARHFSRRRTSKPEALPC